MNFPTSRGLLCHADTPAEAANSVANVVRFMSTALLHVGDGGTIDEDADGVRIILETCADTLDFHFRKGGGS